jgi:hypothetical protein
MEQEKSQYGVISEEMKNMQCFNIQTRILAASYIFFVVGDFVMMPVGNKLFDKSKDFECYEESIVVV